jgi:hypothetical protein
VNLTRRFGRRIICSSPRHLHLLLTRNEPTASSLRHLYERTAPCWPGNWPRPRVVIGRN